MSSPSSWESLLIKAFTQLDAGNVPNNLWTLGGGTVLMFHFAHRESKDIDIFFSNKQLLGAVSPRINDGVEKSLRDYIEQDNFCKLLFPEGKIDFIYSRAISGCTPQPRMLAGRMVQCEDPVEIAAKKVFWRNDRFTARDIFDLAVVCNAEHSRLVEALLKYPDKVKALGEQITYGNDSGMYDEWVATASILPAGRPFLNRAVQDVSVLIEEVRLQSKKQERPGLSM